MDASLLTVAALYDVLLLDWIVSTADSDLLLPEQVAPLLAPDVVEEWLERWGPSVHPLLWSHGAFLAAVAG